MAPLFASLCLMIGLILGGCAQQSAHQQSAPNYTEALALTLRAEDVQFVPDPRYNQDLSIGHVAGFVPDGQVGRPWSQQISLLQSPPGRHIDIDLFVGEVVNQFRKHCAKVTVDADSVSYETDATRQKLGLDGRYKVHITKATCHGDMFNNPQSGAVTTVLWSKGIEGWLHDYIVQRNWRGSELAPDNPSLSPDAMARWQRWFSSIIIFGRPDDVATPSHASVKSDASH